MSKKLFWTAVIKNIILDKKIYPQKFVYSDTQYYAQPYRRLAIRKGKYKYIYNKSDKSEELYDLDFDPHENVNLLIDEIVDFDRKKIYALDEVYHYPYWDDAKNAYFELKKEKDRIWRDDLVINTFWFKIKDLKKIGIFKMISFYLKNKMLQRGRWGAAVKLNL